MGPKNTVASAAGAPPQPNLEPIRRSSRNIDRNERKKKQEEEEQAKAKVAPPTAEKSKTTASTSKAKPKSTAGKSTTAKGAQVRGRGAKKADAGDRPESAPAKKIAVAAAQKSASASRKTAPKKGAVSANKPNTKKPRKSTKQALLEQEEEDGEEDEDEAAEESADGEEVALSKGENPGPAPAPRGRKRKSTAPSQPTTKKRKIAVPRKSKLNRKLDPSPEIEMGEDGEEDEETGGEEGSDEEENEEDEDEGQEDEEVEEAPTKRPKNKGKKALPRRKSARATSPKDEEEIHYLPDFKTSEDFDKESPGITYNSSPSEEVPNVTIPVGFRVKVTAFEITRIESKDESSVFECNCKQYNSCTFLKTCKHLLLINGPRFERKRLNDIRSKLDGKTSNGVAQEGLEAAPSKPTEATETSAVAGDGSPSESSLAVVGEESTQMDLDGEEDGVSGQ
ncbi:hypothetical protein TWF506_010967 [Arthrobotrys conoides]|uniref:Uncharacterized protein n=1 Tax=Arthrobotrys conoides TaxID=74498 RepID=A0AAN8RMR5_9PEZI